jgi:hypothetical protein
MVKTLKNGASITAYYWVEDREIAVILAVYRGEFVTWLMDADNDTFQGHYFKNYRAALMDFFDRIKQQLGGLIL